MNILTTSEARAIVRHRGFGGRVTDSLYTLAISVLEPVNRWSVYAAINWDEDDGSEPAFDNRMQERSERLQVAIERDNEFKNGGF